MIELWSKSGIFIIGGHTRAKTITSPQLTKRDFLKFFGSSLCILSFSYLLGFPETSRAQIVKKGLIKTKLSPYFNTLERGEIQCELCLRRCRVPKGKRDFCRVRENRDGKYYSLVYGNPCTLHLDPIERNPFFHVLPATTSFSIATAGCNFQCKFCQSWETSQAFPEDIYSYDIPPEMVVKKAKEMGACSIAFTDTEPIIFCEYMIDVCYLARKAGLLNVIHSNGFINEGPLRNLCKVLDAANIDLKGFTETFYRDFCSGELPPVLKTLKILKEEKIHLEITNLMIPTNNDEMSVVREMCLWVKKELGSYTPIHFFRFYPLYKLRNLPPTPVSTLEKARAVALSSGLEYIYIGNIPGHEGGHTFCSRCKKMVIQRAGFMVGEMHLKGGKCGYCGKPIAGIWK